MEHTQVLDSNFLVDAQSQLEQAFGLIQRPDACTGPQMHKYTLLHSDIQDAAWFSNRIANQRGRDVIHLTLTESHPRTTPQVQHRHFE